MRGGVTERRSEHTERFSSHKLIEPTYFKGSAVKFRHWSATVIGDELCKSHCPMGWEGAERRTSRKSGDLGMGNFHANLSRTKGECPCLAVLCSRS